MLRLIMLLIFLGCQGYQFQQNRNPLKKKGITKIYIPSFYNESSIPNITGDYTREIKRMLASFTDLQIVFSAQQADATLVGAITSAQTLSETVRSQSEIGAKSQYGDELTGQRADFYIPTQMMISGKVVLKLIESSGETALSEVIPIQQVYTRELLKGESLSFQQTRSRGARVNAIKESAVKVANTFKEILLYAF